LLHLVRTVLGTELRADLANFSVCNQSEADKQVYQGTTGSSGAMAVGSSKVARFIL